MKQRSCRVREAKPERDGALRTEREPSFQRLDYVDGLRVTHPFRYTVLHAPYAMALLFCAVAFSVSTLFAAAPPAPARPSDQQIHRWIEMLGDKDFFVRQKAEQELAKTGFDAVDALAEAADSDDMEIVARADRLLRAIRSNWTRPGDPPLVLQSLGDYELQDDATREARVAALIALADQQGVPAVCRIICYDRSNLIAKTAAVRLIESLSTKDVKPGLAAEIRKQFANCRRLAAQWVLDWLAAVNDPEALVSAWSKIVTGEDDLLRRRPRDSSPAIVEGLLQLQIAALRRARHGSDAATAVARLMSLHRGDPAALARLLQWLMDQKDWPATRLVETQFRTTIAASPDLLYLLAEAQALRGDAAAADRSAEQALKLNPDVDERSLSMHLQAGRILEDRGRGDWAIHEWDYVARRAPNSSTIGTIAAHYLAELYHDLDRDDQAASTLARLVKAFEGRTDQYKLFGNEESLSLGAMRARQHYFEACHWRDKGDRAKQRAALDAALAIPDYDIEVLIECFRLPDASAEYRAKTRKLIVKKLNQLREQIGDNDVAQPCNEFAWLAANTEGDLDEALRLSKRSLELAGENNGSYRDTLARVYFAKGEFDEALKQETDAAAALPHNRAILKQLEVYRAKAAEKKGSTKSESRKLKQDRNQKTE
jgi:tetratricopeptide (TPR) repeat protein